MERRAVVHRDGLHRVRLPPDHPLRAPVHVGAGAPRRLADLQESRSPFLLGAVLHLLYELAPPNRHLKLSGRGGRHVAKGSLLFAAAAGCSSCASGQAAGPCMRVHP